MSKNKNSKRKSAAKATKATKVTNVSDQLSEAVVKQHLTPNPLSQFSLDKDELRLALVTAQYALRATREEEPPTSNQPTGLLVLVNGMEQAGKGSAVKQLRQWVDPRLLKVEATIGDAPLDYQPLWQVHTKALPRHGDVMVYFGNWYADLIYNVMRMTRQQADDDNQKSTSTSAAKKGKGASKKSTKDGRVEQWQQYLQEQLQALQTFEHDLATNQTKLLKCWFHVDADTLQKRITDKETDPEYLYQIDWRDADTLTQFNQVAASIIRQQGDWVIIDGADKAQATNQFCHEVLQAMQSALVSSRVPSDEAASDSEGSLDTDKPPLSTATVVDCDHLSSVHNDAEFTPVAIPDVLTDINDPDLDKSDYQDALAEKQTKLAALLRARGGRHVVFALEGMDAAGKGGAIKRLVAPLDPREYQIYNIGAPMRYELQHPYLWRFWTRLPNEKTDRISRIAIFDRTWYGRVLVERVEGFATEAAWQRAYAEINRFEADLVAAGTIVIKYWLAIDKDEQLDRFEDRRDTPHKQFKLTDDDWRNRDKWSDYVQAAADMLARTNTAAAPWCVIATNDKRTARLQVLDHAIAQLEKL